MTTRKVDLRDLDAQGKMATKIKRHVVVVG
jgi:hypothetical protein